MHIQKMDPIEHGIRVAREAESGDGWDAWRGYAGLFNGSMPAFNFPDSDERIPAKPWLRDEDELLKPKLVAVGGDRAKKALKILEDSGPLVFSTGNTRPGYDGRTSGVFLNLATKDDPEFTISSQNHRKNLVITTGGGSSYHGQKVRIPKNAVAQGYPMFQYSDHKLHIYDVDSETFTEIQYIIDTTQNPVLSALLDLMKIFGIGKGSGGLQCHGIRRYKRSDRAIEADGSSVTKIPLAMSTLRYDDANRGYIQMSGIGIKCAHHRNVAYPARMSDGKETDPNAPMMGEVLKLKLNTYCDLVNLLGGYENIEMSTRTILDSWLTFGMMIVDTASQNSTSLEPDKRWNQEQLNIIKDHVNISDFELYRFKPTTKG